VSKAYDLIVIGTGVAASIANQCAAQGSSVAVVDHRDFGGTRTLRGCTPKKVLTHTASVAEATCRLSRKTLAEAPVEIDWPALIVRAFDADLVFHSAGRVPALADLDLEAGEVAVENGRLALTEHLQSESNPRVFAAGDAAARGPMLTPVATLEADVVVANLGGAHRTPDYTGVPSVVFSEPPLARVGLSEQAAREAGVDVEVRCESTSGWFGPRYQAQPCAGFKTVVDRDSGRVLGAHLLGPAADEVINLFALAVRHAMTADQLRDTVMVFPTAAHDVKSML